MRQRSREQVIGFLLAILATSIIVIEFIIDAKINTAPPPRVVWVESFPENRTDEEIVAEAKERQARREAIALERQQQFQRLQNKLGIE
ncbi:MAG TPA: hypothetical protein VM346_01895 [Sphingomicrobium sp.]|nr:hypothetical protein [Sphingomicrobium sp.]HXH53809.1 hypothetical protein [Sphingomicrobium sp.]